MHVPSEFFAPGFWVVLAGFGLRHQLRYEFIDLPSSDHIGYASAMGLPVALGSPDDYGHSRLREGHYYSSLERLDNPEVTDIATGRVNSCIRKLLSDADAARFVAAVCNVVSELHSNVWDHGEASGFSVAQRWQGGRFEFALADTGRGFLNEVRRAGLPIDTDAEAIDWCMREGTSSKRQKPDDGWAQRLPPDALRSPYPPSVSTTVTPGIHHAGLGLWKLRELVRVFSGTAWVATGSACTILNGDSADTVAIPEWRGVAIACRFTLEGIKSAPAEADNPRVAAIMKILGGEPVTSQKTITLDGPDLTSRRAAVPVRLKVEALASAKNRVVIDLTAVESVSDSFADELFGVLALNNGLKWCSDHISVYARDSVLRAIAAVVERRCAERGEDPLQIAAG